MKASTANFIVYNLRPSKQAERRIILDFLKCANEIGFPISGCRYVGMGGTAFYDFHLLHRFLGINNMISLERDPKMHPRSEFNCPFDFISVRNQSVADFLVADKDETVTIYWLDYDDSIGPDITGDIVSLGTRLKVGGFAFVTVCAHPPGNLQRPQERLDYFQEYLSDFSVDLTVEDMASSAFPATVYQVLMTAFRKAFAAHPDGVFRPLFRVQYKDTIDMVTVGGCLSTRGTAATISKRVRADLPFLFKPGPYKIEKINLTEREKVLFDKAVTKQDPNSDQATSLRSLGFKQRDFRTYRDLIRFLPRYHESII